MEMKTIGTNQEEDEARDPTTQPACSLHFKAQLQLCGESLSSSVERKLH
jgi:hypothetical protein